MKKEYCGVTGSRIAYYGSKLAEKNKKTLMIVSTEKAAGLMASDLSFNLIKADLHQIIIIT